MIKRGYKILWCFFGMISIFLLIDGAMVIFDNFERNKYIVKPISKEAWVKKYGKEVVPFAEIDSADIALEKSLPRRVILAFMDTKGEAHGKFLFSFSLIFIGSILQYIIWGSLHPLYLFRKKK
jgi:hypothetical protein